MQEPDGCPAVTQGRADGGGELVVVEPATQVEDRASAARGCEPTDADEVESRQQGARVHGCERRAGASTTRHGQLDGARVERRRIPAAWPPTRATRPPAVPPPASRRGAPAPRCPSWPGIEYTARPRRIQRPMPTPYRSWPGLNPASRAWASENSPSWPRATWSSCRCGFMLRCVPGHRRSGSTHRRRDGNRAPGPETVTSAVQDGPGPGSALGVGPGRARTPG